MTIAPHDIEGRPAPPPGFSHVTVAQGSRTVHIAGQVGTDAEGNVVPGGLAGQTEAALLNLARALETVGATPADLASVRLYVVGWDPSKMEDLGRGTAAAGQHVAFDGRPAATLIGVQTLFTPDMLIEIEAVAVLD